jgi:ABC-2 type transport system ATP-binding protein
MTTPPTEPRVAVPLRVVDLTRRRGGRVVLDGVSLAVPVGSVLGLLGKNGAGKTTLISCALGLARADAGGAFVLGEPASDLSAAAKARLGFVPQEIALYPWMTAWQMLSYTSAFYPRWNGTLVDRLLREWEVRPGDRIGRMSLGTRQKLAIIQQLAHEPDLLVLDEPAASLDPAARREFLKAVLQVTVDGRRTVVFSTHIMSDLERVADRVAILGGGHIVFDGELDVLKDSVKRLHVSADRPLDAGFAVPGAVRTRVDGAAATVSVRDVGEADLAELRERYGADVRVEDLNLEEIFLEMQGS